MENMEANLASQKFFDYAVELPEKTDVVAKFKEATVKGSQLNRCSSSPAHVQAAARLRMQN